jgi:hypothetical protein
VIHNVTIDQTLVVLEEAPPPDEGNYLVLAAIAMLVVGIGGGIFVIRTRKNSAISEVDSNSSED